MNFTSSFLDNTAISLQQYFHQTYSTLASFIAYKYMYVRTVVSIFLAWSLRFTPSQRAYRTLF